MEEMNRRELIRTPQLEDFPELIHLIQSSLAAKEAARTCILSKSWLHAWSTIPTLRFTKVMATRLVNGTYPHVTKEETKYNNLITNTLQRYHRDNIPIENLDIHFIFRDVKSAFLVEKWIMCLASKSCLKELSLTTATNPSSYPYLNVIFSCKNLNKLSVTNNPSRRKYLKINTTVIKCVSLRVLELIGVHLSEEVLPSLFATCRLLEKITLHISNIMRIIKVKNLRYLQELQISSQLHLFSLKVDEVPSLQSFILNKVVSNWRLIPINIDTLRTVTELSLGGVIIDDALLDMIKYKFHFLETLTLQIESYSRLKSMNITCLSLKRLTIRFLCKYNKVINLQVYAPKLLHFSYIGFVVPSLLFPTVTPERIKLTFHLYSPINHSFFLKMNETLKHSTTFDIEFVPESREFLVALDFGIDALRANVPFLYMNVHRLLFSTYNDSCSFEHLHFFDVFLSVYHPSYVTVCQPIPRIESESSMVNELMKKIIKRWYWSQLKDVEIENLDIAISKAVENGWIDNDMKDLEWSFVELKLNWRSP